MAAILTELERMLENLTLQSREEHHKRGNWPSINLVNVAPLDLSKIVDLASQSVSYQAEPLKITSTDRVANFSRRNLTFNAGRFQQTLHGLMQTSRQLPTLNGLLASLLAPTLLRALEQIPERPYPSAKLLICDSSSYELLAKFRRLAACYDENLIYKHPFNVTAILLLSDVVDIVNRENEPLIEYNGSALLARGTASYNYRIVRRTFPYLKLSDLIVVLRDKKNLAFGHFSLEAPREHQVLQLLNNFSRSTTLVETQSINKLIGHPHRIYDNVTAMRSLSVATNRAAVGIRLNLGYISAMAEQLVQLANQLRLAISSVSFPVQDVYGQLSMFARFVGAAYQPSRESARPLVGSARVLVMDRYTDVASALCHADRYGAFIEQEQSRDDVNLPSNDTRFSDSNKLDEPLQLVPLTEALSAVLKLTINLRLSHKPKKPDVRKFPNLTDAPHTTGIGPYTSKSIAQHLDFVRGLYSILSEGYLLILRLESNLGDTTNELRSLMGPLSQDEQEKVLGRLQRTLQVLSRLVSKSGKSIRADDLYRVAAIMIDVVNLFLQKNSTGLSDKITSNLREIKSSLINGNFARALKTRIQRDEQLQTVQGKDKLANDWAEKSISFDRLSQESATKRCPLPMEKLVEKFHLGQVDKNVYQTIELLSPDTLKNKDVTFVVFLGALSPHELSKIKALEADLTGQLSDSDRQNRMYLLVGEIKGPTEILAEM